MKKLVFPLFTMMAFCTVILTCAPPSFALLAEHLDYDGCDSCHSLHGSGGGYQLLAGVDTEATCLACHGSLTPVATEVAVHDPAGVGVGNQGYITCRECHGAHDNEGNNIKLVGYDWDPVVDPGKDNAFANPTIRVELTTSDISSPVYQNVTFETRPDDFKRSDNAGVCEVCHNAGPTSGTTVLQDHEWGDCVVCHMHEDGFKKRQCVECHDVNATLVADAPKVLDKTGVSVGQVGSHLRVDGSDLIIGLTDLEWTVQCIECHTGHSGDVIVPNNATVGINYMKTGGIGLGGNATIASATSEADICWDCHGPGQSEWNASSYSLSTKDWTDPTAQFTTDAVTLIPDRPVRSIHSANPHYNTATGNVNSVAEYQGGDTQIIENAEAIRCSYCHDVHSIGLNGYTPSGQPYLRGTWLSNPYNFDAPPKSGDSYPDNKWHPNHEGFPRLIANTSSSKTGTGYFIDQNSDWPTLKEDGTFMDVADTAGLCQLCHNEATDDLDYYDTSLWAGFGNGHANSVLGGGGAASLQASNLFDGRRNSACISVFMGAQGGYWLKNQSSEPSGNLDGYGIDTVDTADYSVDCAGGLAPDNDSPYGESGLGEQPANSGWSNIDGVPANNSGWYGDTAEDATNVPDEYDTWYSAGGIGTAGIYSIDKGAGANTVDNTRAHNFSCSKCHNPHASGLPALLETNCLDVTLSTWEVTTTGDNARQIGATPSSSWGRRVASNCHRRWDGNSESGWNTMAEGI